MERADNSDKGTANTLLEETIDDVEMIGASWNCDVFWYFVSRERAETRF